MSGENTELCFPLIHCDFTEARDTSALMTLITAQISSLQFPSMGLRSQGMVAQEMRRWILGKTTSFDFKCQSICGYFLSCTRSRCPEYGPLRLTPPAR